MMSLMLNYILFIGLVVLVVAMTFDLSDTEEKSE